MRRLLFVLLLSVGVSAAPRPEVFTYAPTQFAVASGERYLTIEGSNFMSGPHNPTVVFLGPNGPIELTPSSMSGYDPSMRIQVWVPQEILQQIGRYEVSVRNAVNGESDPFAIEVTGDSNIIIRTPSSILIEATGPSGAVVTYEASAESTTGAEVDFGCTPASGTTFPLGHHSVVCTGSTADGASRSVPFVVTVYDRTPPVLTIPEDIFINGVDRAGEVVEWEATAVDAIDTDVPVRCSPASGSTFLMNRTTEVRCSATDDSFNSTVRSFTVTISDYAFPRLTVPEDLTVPATSWNGAEVTYTAWAVDYSERPLEIECAPASGMFFPIGISTATCSATDDMGRTTHATFRVTVTPPPDPPPTLHLPEDITVEATSDEGAVVTFTATATDYDDRTIAITCSPASGSLFRVGYIDVHCFATDDRDQLSEGSFRVTVTEPEEEQPPTLTLPADLTVEAATPDGTVVHFTATAHDEEDGAIPVTCTPPSGATFPVGTTAVACSATNSRGATASGTFQVRVTDTAPPVIVSITATPDRLWPVNKRMVNVSVSVTAADDGDATLSARIVSVSVSERASDTDWRIVDDLIVALRADRNGKEQPRVYTIVVEVSDSSGNLSTGTVQVLVPHDGSDNGTTTQPPPRRRSARH